MTVLGHSSHDSSNVKDSTMGQKNSQAQQNRQDLLECLDAGIMAFAGCDIHRTIYLKKNLASKIIAYRARDGDVFRNPKIVEKAIKNTFGPDAEAVERAVAKEIMIRFGLDPSESHNLVSAIHAASDKNSETRSIAEVSETPKKWGPIHALKSFVALSKSEYRVTIFVWSLVTAYLLATNLKPNFLQLGELVVAWYFVSFGVYVFNALTDVREDRIDHPNRPLASSSTSISEAWGIFGVSIAISFVTSLFISIPVFIFVLASFLMGIAYSHPRIRAKRYFPLKILISVAGAVIVSLCGGIAAGNLDAAVYFSAIFFGLFAMVTLLLGDVSDIRGDTTVGVKSLPIVMGLRNSIFFIACIPLVIAFIGVTFFRIAGFNPMFPLLILVITAYSSLNIISLLGKYDDHEFVRNVKSRMRLIHFLLQLSLVLGLLAL